MVFGPIFDPVREEDLQTETLFEEPIVVAAGSHNDWVREPKYHTGGPDG